MRHLVELARDGNLDAFSELASASIAGLYAVARLILRDSDRAEDAVQDALVEVWQHMRSLRDPDRFDGWMHRLLVRACYRHARREKQRALVEIHLLETDAPRPDDGAVSFADRDQLERGFEIGGGVGITACGASVWASGSGGIGEIDPATNTEVRILERPGEFYDLAWTSDGTWATTRGSPVLLFDVSD